MNTMAMHSRLLKNIQDQEDSRVYYEGLQDKLAQVISTLKRPKHSLGPHQVYI
jgi:hypothetical protein